MIFLKIAFKDEAILLLILTIAVFIQNSDHFTFYDN